MRFGGVEMVPLPGWTGPCGSVRSVRPRDLILEVGGGDVAGALGEVVANQRGPLRTQGEGHPPVAAMSDGHRDVAANCQRDDEVRIVLQDERDVRIPHVVGNGRLHAAARDGQVVDDSLDLGGAQPLAARAD